MHPAPSQSQSQSQSLPARSVPPSSLRAQERDASASWGARRLAPNLALHLKIIRFPLLPSAVPFEAGGWAPFASWLGQERSDALVARLKEVFPEALTTSFPKVVEAWVMDWLRWNVDEPGEIDLALLGPWAWSLQARDYAALTRRG